MEKTDPLVLTLRALEFAAWKHRDQRRKNAEASPYINHPIALATVLRTEGDVDDVVVLAAALLHDTIEDTQTTWQELRGEFGEEIADIVLEVTDSKWLNKNTRKRLQVQKASKSSERAKLVKLADKICNLRDILASPPAEWSLDRLWRIRNFHLKTITETVLFLTATFPNLPGHEGPVSTRRTFIYYHRQTPGTRWCEGRRRRQPPHEAATPGHQSFSATRTQSLGI